MELRHKIYPLLVYDDEQWELLRLIRNSCREGLTHTTTEITREMQRLYRSSVQNNPHIRHYIYYDNGVAIGFSRLEWKTDNYVYPTMGVASWARGKGYGWDIMSMLLLAAGGPLKGDLLTANEAIKRIDYTLGYVNDGPAVQGIQPVTCEWPPPFIMREK